MSGYVTPQELIDYAAARGVVITADEAPILLTLAMDYIDAQGLDYPTDPVPDDIVKAQLVAALLTKQGEELLAPVGQRVLSELVDGAVTLSYSDQGRATNRYPQLDALLAPYRPKGVGFMQVMVTR